MSKNAEKPKEKKLPDHYPRKKEILIFSDMSELDHVFESLDEIQENVYSTAPTSDDEWRELINHSGIYHLIHVLRKACFEFERFWIEDDSWKLEDDEEFMDCMNDPDELQWLVTELDFGRVKPVAEKNVRFYEPAYHAAARSLQIAMYACKYPGDKDWIDYCVNQLKQTLTRYHAAALEIVMHRDNIYLSNKQKYFPSIDRMNAGNEKRVRDQQEKAADDYAEIKREFGELSKIKPHKNKTNLVKELVSKGYSERTIWRALEDNPDAQE